MKTFAIAAVAALSLGAAAEAATVFHLSGPSILLTPAFDPNPGVPEIPAYDWAKVNGSLTLSGPGRVTFRYVGAEAGFRNLFSTPGGPGFDTGAAANPSFSLDRPGGLMQFSFSTAGGVGAASNGPGGTSYYQAIALYQTRPTTVYALFNDGAPGDTDFDDMVVRLDVAPVPLPAAAWLLLGGLGGLGVIARRRSAPTAA